MPVMELEQRHFIEGLEGMRRCQTDTWNLIQEAMGKNTFKGNHKYMVTKRGQRVSEDTNAAGLKYH